MIFYYSKYKTISATLSYDVTVIFSIKSLDDQRSNFRHTYFQTWATFLFENSPPKIMKKWDYLNPTWQLQPEVVLCLNLFFTCFHENIICMHECMYANLPLFHQLVASMNYLLLISFEKSSFERVGKLALGSSVKLNWQVTEMVFSDMGILFSMQWEEFASSSVV